MPDLMIVHMQQCSSCYGLQTYNVGGYEQEINFSEGRPYHHCTCKGFQYGQRKDDFYGKTCKHLDEVRKGLCLYHEQFDGPPDEKGKCPKCGSETVTVRVGV